MVGALVCQLEQLSIVEFPENINIEELNGIPKSILGPRNSRQPQEPKVSVSIIGGGRLTGPQSVKNTIKIDLQVSEKADNWDDWAPGDSIGVLAPNSTSDCRTLCDLLNCSSPDLLTKLEHEKSIHFGFALKKGFLKFMSLHATDNVDKSRLLYLISKEGLQLYRKFSAMNWSVLNLLMQFQSCRPPMEELLEQLPDIRPRYYSICTPRDYCKESGQFNSKTKTFSIVLNVVEFETAGKKKHKGHCSGYLDGLLALFRSGNSDISLKVTQRHMESGHAALPRFLAPQDPSVPLLLVGPGTGIAPLIAMARERAILAENGNIAPTILVYGCRHATDVEKLDWLLSNEMKAISDSVKIVLAVSRESASALENIHINSKSYVGAVFSSHKKLLEEIFHLAGSTSQKQAKLYFCGDAMMMGKSFNNVLETFVLHYDSEFSVLKWKKNGIYYQELW